MGWWIIALSGEARVRDIICSVSQGKQQWQIEERFLSAQADTFIPKGVRDGEECAGAKVKEKVGLLRSE